MNKQEGSKTRYYVQWDTHARHMCTILCSLMEHQSLVDLAICCGTNTIHAHKCVLAANSPYFREQLEKNSGTEQIIISGLDFAIVKSIIEFMYCGETNILDENLKYMVAAAKFFQMRGLQTLVSDHQEIKFEAAMSTESGGEDSIQQLLNDTDSELSGLSHLDAPNESLYMIGGVLIAMFLVGVIIILLAITISKLRKREEHSNSVHPADVVLQTSPAPPPNAAQAPLSTAVPNVQVQPSADPLPYRGQLLWQYPPQPNNQYSYSNNQDTLVRTLPTERPGFVQGFRKNLGGRWRRFVKRKTSPEVYAIPPELRPQLKTIYVY